MNGLYITFLIENIALHAVNKRNVFFEILPCFCAKVIIFNYREIHSEPWHF